MSLKRFLFVCKKRISASILQTALCQRINEMVQNALATTHSTVSYNITSKTITVLLPLGTSLVFPVNTFLTFKENSDIPWNSDYGNVSIFY